MENEIFAELKHYVFSGHLSDSWLYKPAKEIKALVNEYEFDHIEDSQRNRFTRATTGKDLIICLTAGFKYNDIELKEYAVKMLRQLFSSKAGLPYFESNINQQLQSEDLSTRHN